MSNLPKDNTFAISFDTKKDAKVGTIRTVTVTLKEDVMAMDDIAYVNLCEHPLYPALVKYVKANPARRN